MGYLFRVKFYWINMGKHVPKCKSIKEDEIDEDDGQIDELYRPFLIHSTTYVLLTEQILTLMPSQRYVLLTMNEYDLNEINPLHPNTADSPTHVIIFCIRFIADDIFQPIGGLLIYKYKDQSAILAECLKAYINDLWKLGLNVVGTVSPPFESFKGMLKHLIDVKDFDTYAGSLVYSVAPIKEIVHIYDIQFLLIKLQNLFKEGNIKFHEVSREYIASWNDISLVLNLSSEFKILSNYLTDNKDVSRRVHIFTQQIFEQLLSMEAQGILSENAGGSAVLLNCIRSFLQFTELDLVDLNIMCQIDGWSNFTDILPTMMFQKSQKRTCTKRRPTTIHTLKNSSIRRKIDFEPTNNEDMHNLAKNMEEVLLIDELKESLKSEDIDSKSTTIHNRKKSKKNDGRNNKQQKRKGKDSGDVIEKEEKTCTMIDETKLENNQKIKLHSKKPYDKQKFGKHDTKKSNIVVESEKTESENIGKPTTTYNGEIISKHFENKLIGKTDDFSEHCRKFNQDNLDNKTNINCDKNNNTNENNILDKSTSSETKCDNKSKLKNRRNKNKLREENYEMKEEDFDIVINNAQKFFESFFIGLNTGANTFDSVKNKDIPSDKLHTSAENAPIIGVEESSTNCVNNICSNGQSSTGCYNDFCSQTDEETENCVTKICDKVPTIVESLSNEESTDNSSDEYEPNDVTYELLCTAFGMKKLMENLVQHRVKTAKPDAFVVEHVDFFVTIIKKDKNKINPVHYYGHNYDFLNVELAFSTLENNTGLFLIKT